MLQPSLRPADYLEAFQAFRAAREYFAQKVTARQRRPANDLLSALATAETDGSHDAPAIACVLLGASPVQLHGRIALTDVEVRESKIPAGDKLILLIGAANRDPRAYSRPDHLDLRRSETHGLSFGGGAHHCLGEAVARTTAGIAIARLLADLPGRRRSGNRLRWRTDQPAIRGLRELIVTIPG